MSCSIAKRVSTRVSGKAILAVVVAWNATPTEIDMRVISLTVSLMERVSIHGPTAKCTKVNGHTASKKVKVSGRESLATAISASGTSQKRQAMVFISGRMATASKESGLIVSSMAARAASL